MATRPAIVPPAAPIWTSKTELSSDKVGGKIVFATDEWFAHAENLLNADPPEWKEDVFTTQGKWMDGWESRRKRIAGHDWCVIKLGIAGVVDGISVDTAFFSGNFVPKISVQAACLPMDTAVDGFVSQIGQACTDSELHQARGLTCTATGKQCDQWTELIPMKPLGAGYEDTRMTYFTTESRQRWTHIRVNMYPDGGIARVKVFGDVVMDLTHSKWSGAGASMDLAAVENGSKAVGWSNTHYGHPRNMLNPGVGINMGDGWETARRMDRPTVLTLDGQGHLQVPGYEWCVIELGVPGTPEQVVIATTHYKGNFPESCMVEGCVEDESSRHFGPRMYTIGLDHDECDLLGKWEPLVARTKLKPDSSFTFDVPDGKVIRYVRLSMFPDGGIMRMRIIGQPCPITVAKQAAEAADPQAKL